MKKSMCFLLTLLLLTGCSSGKTIVQGGNSVTVNSTEYQNFTVSVAEGESYAWGDDGLAIYQGEEDCIPYVLVWRSYDDTSSISYLIEGDISNMNYYYGNDLKSSDIQTYEFDKTQYQGVKFSYIVGEDTIQMDRVYLPLSNGYALFTAKYLDEADETADALQLAITSFSANQNGKGEDWKPSYADSVKLTTYSDAYLSMLVPEGWAVSEGSVDNTYAGLVLRAYDTNDPDYQIFISMGVACFTSEENYNWMASYPLYGSYYQMFPYMNKEDNSLNGFFSHMDRFVYSGYGSAVTLSSMYDFTLLKNAGTAPDGSSVILGSYTDEQGNRNQGVFQGTWTKPVGDEKFPGIFYRLVYYTAPEEEFESFGTILAQCAASLTYTETYVSGYLDEQGTNMDNFRANTPILEASSDYIIANWAWMFE